MRPAALALGVCACLAPRSPLPEGIEPPPQVTPQPPDVLAVYAACDRRAGVWQVLLDTGGWVGEATTWWTADGRYVESHPMRSVGYAPDGSGEELYLELTIAPDVFRVEEGASTALSCGADPAIRLTVASPDGPVHACVDLGGPFDEWDAVRGPAACPEAAR